MHLCIYVHRIDSVLCCLPVPYFNGFFVVLQVQIMHDMGIVALV